jgi:hypothetical protein
MGEPAGADQRTSGTGSSPAHWLGRSAHSPWAPSTRFGNGGTAGSRTCASWTDRSSTTTGGHSATSEPLRRTEARHEETVNAAYPLLSSPPAQLASRLDDVQL